MPTMLTSGCPPNEGMLNVVNWPAGVMLPSSPVALAPFLANQTFLSGPRAVSWTLVSEAFGSVNVVTWPEPLAGPPGHARQVPALRMPASG
jgi:hypothetical protein